MNIQDLDLNLLLIFDAIYRDRSISTAGKRLGLSQPTISNALRRLRDYTGDTLFFRNGSQMMPTRVAIALAGPIRHALSTVEEGLTAARNFDPQTSTRTFRLAILDVIRVKIGPTLINVIEREAPNIVLELAETPSLGTNPKAALHNGDIDLAMLPKAAVDATVNFETVMEEQLVMIVRKGHPVLGGAVTKQALDGLRYAVTSTSLPMRALVEHSFLKIGIKRRIGCIVPGTNEISGLVETSDLVGILGRTFVLSYMRDHAVTILNAPITMPKVEGVIAWSKAFDDDQGLQWMRRTLSHVFKTTLSLDA